MVMNTDNRLDAKKIYGVVSYDIDQRCQKERDVFVSSLPKVGALRINQSFYMIHWSSHEAVRSIWNTIESKSGRFGSMKTLAFTPQSENEVRELTMEALNEFINGTKSSLRKSLGKLQERFGDLDEEEKAKRHYAVISRAKRKYRQAQSLAMVWGLTQEVEDAYIALKSVIEAESVLDEHAIEM